MQTIVQGIAAATLAVTFAGCSSAPPAPSPVTQVTSTDGRDAGRAGDKAIPPVMADVADVDGTTQTIAMDRKFVLTGDTAPVDKWTAKVTPSGVVEFSSGRDNGLAIFNPGLSPLAAGEAKVTLANSETGTSVTFTVKVS